MPPAQPNLESPDTAGGSAGIGDGEAPGTSTARTPQDRARRRRLRRRDRLPRLSLGTRIVLHVVGGVLVLLGVLGWFLPILQGWLTLFLGLAVLSLASQTFHRFLRRRFRGWPRGWRRVEKVRRRLGRWLGPKSTAPKGHPPD